MRLTTEPNYKGYLRTYNQPLHTNKEKEPVIEGRASGVDKECFLLLRLHYQ